METKVIFENIVNLSSARAYPDIHLNSSYLPYIRQWNWDLMTINELNNERINRLSNEQVEEIIKIISWEIWLEKLKDTWELDTSYKNINGDRYRVNCYLDSNGYSVAMRLIPSEVPTMDNLWLGDTIKDMCNKSKWLILLTGPTWSGKSTNMAAMINYINQNFKKHIITIEDPIEFSFLNDKSLINQREVWNHTKWFKNAIRASLREDPDVIMIWEMRDAETISSVLTLAETGHLVISTLHTNDTVQAIDRIVDIFPPGQQEQIRMQLALSLIWIISQRLLPKADEEGRIAAREILFKNDAVRNLIITWNTHQLYSVLEVSGSQWMILMDKYISILYQKWIITKETLKSFARDREMIEMILDDE